MDDRQLAELERLERAATPGPWVSWVEGRDGGGGDSFIQAGGGEGPDIYVSWSMTASIRAAAADQDFIAAVRTAFPGLLAEVRRLRDATR
jgi:hypothetical protein